MKKALAILSVLAMVAGVAFADSFGNEAVVSVSGDASLTWGINLDGTQPNGFKNEANWEIKIPLLTKQTFSTKSEGENYAEINIVDAQVNVNGEDGAKSDFSGGDKKIDKVTAKLVFGPVYVVIADKPGFKTNYANIWDPIKNDSYGDAAEEDNIHFEPGFDVVGATKVGYKTDKFDVGARIGSFNNWETQGKSKYAVGADATLTPSDMVSVDAKFNYGMVPGDNADVDAIMSLGAKVVLKPVDGLTATVAFDGGNDYVAADKGTADDAFAFDVLASVAYKFAEAGVYYASAGAPYDFEDEVGTDNADLAAYVKLTDGDFVENLDAWVTVMVENALTSSDAWEAAGTADSWTSNFAKSAMPIRIGAGANYKYAMGDVNYVKPFAELFAQNMRLGYDGTEYVYCGKVGADYGLFTNTVLTAKYEAGGTNDNLRNALVKTASRTTKGNFTLACKVTY